MAKIGSKSILIITSMYPSEKFPHIGMAVKDFIDVQFKSYGDELVLVTKSMSASNYITKTYKYLSLMLLTIKALIVNDIKIIHTHYMGVNFVLLWVINIILKKKFIVTLHGSDLNLVKNTFQKKVLKIMLKRMDAIVCVGIELAEEIERLGINKQNIHVINLGIKI